MSRLLPRPGLLPPLTLLALPAQAATLSSFLVRIRAATRSCSRPISTAMAIRMTKARSPSSSAPPMHQACRVVLEMSLLCRRLAEAPSSSAMAIPTALSPQGQRWDEMRRAKARPRSGFGQRQRLGLSFEHPQRIAEGPDGAIYVVEADTSGSRTATGSIAPRNLNGDGDANDEGEATQWLNLKAINASSSPFEIRFDGDTAFIIDSAGATSNVIYSARDSDGNGVGRWLGSHCFCVQDSLTGVAFDFAMDVASVRLDVGNGCPRTACPRSSV